MNRTLLVIAAASACAMATANMTYLGTVAGTGVGITFDSGGGDTELNAFAGKLLFDATGEGLGIVQTICVDLDNLLGGGDNYDVTPTNTFGLGTGIELAGNIAGTWWNDAGTNNTKCAALQLAAWEAVYDGGGTWDGAGGNFFVRNASAAILTQAETYYNNGINNPHNAIWLDAQGNGQSQLTPVPEPATLAALGIGAVALLRRRRK